MAVPAVGTPSLPHRQAVCRSAPPEDGQRPSQVPPALAADGRRDTGRGRHVARPDRCPSSSCGPARPRAVGPPMHGGTGRLAATKAQSTSALRGCQRTRHARRARAQDAGARQRALGSLDMDCIRGVYRAHARPPAHSAVGCAATLDRGMQVQGGAAAVEPGAPRVPAIYGSLAPLRPDVEAGHAHDAFGSGMPACAAQADPTVRRVTAERPDAPPRPARPRRDRRTVSRPTRHRRVRHTALAPRGPEEEQGGA